MKLQHIDFYLLRFEAGFIDRKKCAEYLGVTVKSIRNWDKQKKAPKAVINLLRLYSGQLEGIGPEWAGFRLRPGVIESDDSNAFIYPGEIRALPYIYEVAGLQRAKVCRILDKRGILRAIRNEKSVSILDDFLQQAPNVISINSRLRA